LFGAPEDSYLYLGPPRSGKTVHLVIPQALRAPGAVVVTETRPDVLRHTAALRAAAGPVAVFDPQHLAGDRVPRLRWAPQHGCTDPLTAIVRARALAAGAELSPVTVTDASYWQGMTEAVLRCYLHAAALDGRTMRDVLTWTARPADPTPVRILRAHPEAAPGWVEELAAQAAADPRQRDSVWAAVRRAVDSLADPRVLDACSPPAGEGVDLAEFVRSRGTVYLLGTTGTQLTVAPLVTALVEALLDAARVLGAHTPSGRLTPPLTVLLDEAANIAPIPSLPNLLADGGGSGITTICVLQSLAQARARWGQTGADAMWDAATTKVILGGLAHAEDLQRISQLAGEIDDPVRTRSHGAGGSSTSVSPRRLPALSVQDLRTLPPGHAIVLARHTPPVHARLRPWWDTDHAKAITASLRSNQ
jgi:type IV secretory pathway TraG/TraD family ATPase VirD4